MYNQGFVRNSCGHDNTTSCANCTSPEKPLDVNKYATKKTIAQGMLDIALLTANASQLKYILQVGHKHEFYTLMLGLITTSLILQVLIGILLLSLNFMRDCKLHLLEYKNSATYINYFTTGVIVGILFLVIGGLDVSVAVLNLILSRLDVEEFKNKGIMTVLNHIGNGCAMFAMISDVIKMSFGLDPALSIRDYYKKNNVTI
ncbi:Ninjurin-2, putative [Pediculus humanus corporis]|uniref:Ninjurin-2, putative n=1 Tax=Pediculus humanus subsp. corporis TaxID=121224 RepID=E0W1I6_PEDHC|nr:Ninjurin-2, putative [Pediculus humanus corporis]EEB19492.1 Ninjurin-2, putative [Pediculus humanus corporis]